jgi:hypothetical protein
MVEQVQICTMLEQTRNPASPDILADDMVTLISNALRKNSAVDHQRLATRIQWLIEAGHPLPAPPGTAVRKPAALE